MKHQPMRKGTTLICPPTTLVPNFEKVGYKKEGEPYDPQVQATEAKAKRRATEAAAAQQADAKGEAKKPGKK